MLYKSKVLSTENMLYPPEFQLNKANVSDTEASCLDLHLSISNGFLKGRFLSKK